MGTRYQGWLTSNSLTRELHSKVSLLIQSWTTHYGTVPLVKSAVGKSRTTADTMLSLGKWTSGVFRRFSKCPGWLLRRKNRKRRNEVERLTTERSVVVRCKLLVTDGKNGHYEVLGPKRWKCTANSLLEVKKSSVYVYFGPVSDKKATSNGTPSK